ncbi:hypothetical protein ACJJTC_007402 [Scirpophaga incertulas]
MNSALKPVLPQPGPQPGGQASPAKGNVANINHAVSLPQGAQNSLHHGTNNLVGQNLTHHAPLPQVAPHAVPSMAPVSANMAQMAQNMSHHGNLSHVTQNSVAPTNMAASPSKSASTSAPLSLVQDKPNTSQPLALTRTPEKKEPDSTNQANGTIESPKSASNAPATFKAQNVEPNKDKQDIAKTSPSTPKPPEKPTSSPTTPQKPEASSMGQTDCVSQPKAATPNEPSDKSAKPAEPTPAPTPDVPVVPSDSKPVPESASDNQGNASTPTKEEMSAAESAKTQSVAKVEEKEEEPKLQPADEKPQAAQEPKLEDKPEPAMKEEIGNDKVTTVDKVEKIEEKKPEARTPAKPETKTTPKPTMKLATVTPPMRKRRHASLSKSTDSAKKIGDGESTPDSRTKRNRTQVQLYQSPTPEIAMATKLSASAGRSTPTKQNDDKLIVFYKNEYLAVRNAEGGFYVCQAMQNVYRTTRKIKIRWLSQDKAADPSGETYKPDFYDVTDMECVLTTLSLQRAAGGGGAQVLRPAEQARAHSILHRALAAEAPGAGALHLTEEHPDGRESLSCSCSYSARSILHRALVTEAPCTSPRSTPTARALHPAPRAGHRGAMHLTEEHPDGRESLSCSYSYSARSILHRALAAEAPGAGALHLTEEHPDGRDSLSCSCSYSARSILHRALAAEAPGAGALHLTEEHPDGRESLSCSCSYSARSILHRALVTEAPCTSPRSTPTAVSLCPAPTRTARAPSCTARWPPKRPAPAPCTSPKSTPTAVILCPAPARTARAPSCTARWPPKRPAPAPCTSPRSTPTAVSLCPAPARTARAPSCTARWSPRRHAPHRGAPRRPARSILQRALAAEAPGAGALHLTEEHPDGLDLSLYTDESQLEKKSRKRNSSKSSPRSKSENANETAKDEASPAKKSRTTPKRSPKSARKHKTSPPKTQTNNKRKSPGSTPTVAATSKVGIVQRIYRNTATAVSEKPKTKATPAKKSPKLAKPDTPVATPTRQARRAAKENKPSPIVATPSTSTGKTTRTPRKPPSKK